jgi:hypothetical protein
MINLAAFILIVIITSLTTGKSLQEPYKHPFATADKCNGAARSVETQLSGVVAQYGFGVKVSAKCKPKR